MRFGVVLAGILMLLSSPGCQPEDAPRGVLARVDDRVITLGDFDREFREMKLENEFFPGGHETLMRMRERFLDQLIDEALVLKEAKRMGVTVTEQELEEEIMKTKDDYKGESLREHLNSQGISFEEWKEDVRRTMVVEKTIRMGSHYGGVITTDEARTYYEAHRVEYMLPERVKARQIVVATQRNASRILRELKKGKEFEELAVENSLGPEGRFGGDLGYFARGEMPKEFDVVFSMDSGQVSGITKSHFGFHIFKVEEKTPGRQLEFEEVVEHIQGKLAQMKSEQQYYQWLEGLRRNAKIEINHDLLAYTH